MKGHRDEHDRLYVPQSCHRDCKRATHDSSTHAGFDRAYMRNGQQHFFTIFTVDGEFLRKFYPIEVSFSIWLLDITIFAFSELISSPLHRHPQSDGQSKRTKQTTEYWRRHLLARSQRLGDSESCRDHFWGAENLGKKSSSKLHPIGTWRLLEANAENDPRGSSALSFDWCLSRNFY